MSLSNMVLGFYEEAERERWPEDDAGCGNGNEEEEEERSSAAESSAFWEEQWLQLHEALAKTSSAERRIRADTEEAVRQARAAAAAGVCSCASRSLAVAGLGGTGCRSCALRFVAGRLRDSGYDSAVCRSRWPRSPDTPAGEHAYVDVVEPTRSGKAVRVVIEPSFWAEFAMARGGAGYGSLVGALPEVFVGRAEKLRAVVGAMCVAAKRCKRESNMHMAPWRKRRYMEAKWLSTPDRLAPGASVVAVGSPESEKQRRVMQGRNQIKISGG